MDNVIRLYRGAHARTCECNSCLRRKLAAYEDRVRAAMAGGARPDNEDCLVPVRAHFRSQPNYLKNTQPLLQGLVAGIVRGLLNDQHRRRRS